MKKFILADCFVLLLLLLSACSPFNAQEKKALESKRELYEILQGNLSLPVSARVLEIPADFLKGVKDYDRSLGMGNADRYLAYMPNGKELATFKAYVELLPRSYQSLFKEKLLAVYFVENFSGGGMTEWVVDRNGNSFYYMVLNSALLKESLDDWLSDKENSFFEKLPASPVMRVHTGTNYRAVMYALLHEGTHVLDFEKGVTPYVDALHRKFKNRKKETSAFTDGVWLQQTQPLARYDFSHRAALNPYGEYSGRGLIAKSEMQTMFAQLAQTPFAGFYGGTSWNEDLADFMTYQIIEKKLGGAVSVDLIARGKVIGQYMPVRTPLSGQRENAVRMFYD
jgi:hypothetical protein